MLKIKYDVDLKELEKFGFRNHICFLNKDTKNISYFINKDTRIIEIWTYYNDEVGIDNTLYDLIKADLVEVVE